MEKYINKLKSSSDLRNKMLLNLETQSYYDPDVDTSLYKLTYMTDSDTENNDNIFIDVKSEEILWDGYDPEYKVVAVFIKKFVNNKLVNEKNHIAIYWEDLDEYFYIPKNLAKKEKLI